MNIPNALSIFRIALVPLFVAVYFGGHSHAHMLATGIFLLAGATDVIDGHLARKLGQVTLLGRVLDPLADKLMVLAALVCCTVSGYIPLWAVILFAAKESAQALLSFLLFRKIKEVPASNIVGKAGTVLFYITIAVNIVFEVPAPFSLALLSVSLGCIFAALVTYVIRGVRISRELERDNLPPAA